MCVQFLLHLAQLATEEILCKLQVLIRKLSALKALGVGVKDKVVQNPTNYS